MMNLFIEHFRVLRSTLQRLLLTLNVTLLNILIIGIALSLPVGGYVLLKSIQSLATQATGTPQISVFLVAGTSSGEIDRISDKLKQNQAIKRIEFISREIALKQLQRSVGLSDVISRLQQNPLPDAFIIYPKSADASTLEALRNELSILPYFENVQLDSAWVHKLEALLDFAHMAVAILAVLLSFALITITFNTIRLQILTRREEIEVAKLFGATDAFIRRPFLYFGLTQGLMGGVTALMLVAGCLQLLNYQLGTLTLLYSSNFSLQNLSFGDSVTLLVFSAYLGWLGAWFSVSQHLLHIQPR